MVSKYSCILLLILGSSLALPLDRAAADEQQYRGIFDKLDQDGDGEVTQAEVLSVLQSLGYDATTEEAAEFMDNVDNVDFDTFVELSTSSSHTDEEIKNAFELFDKDADTYIDLSEMTSLLGLYDLGNAGAYLQAF